MQQYFLHLNQSNVTVTILDAERIHRNISCLAFFIISHEKDRELVELNGLQKICEETSKFGKIPKLFFIEVSFIIVKLQFKCSLLV